MSTATLYAADETDLGVPMLLTVNGRSFFRYYTGSRGRAAAWRSAVAADLPDDFYATRFVVVDVTTREIDLLLAGQVTPINVKVMKEYTNGRMTDLFEGEQPSFKDICNKDGGANTNSHAQPEPAMALATVPDHKWSDQYINRKVIGDLTEFDVYDVAMRDGDNVLITGHAGSGKTMSVMAYAANRGYRYYNVSSHNGVEPTQLFGRWVPTTNGSFRWQDGPVTDCVRNGDAVLLINEVNFMPERVKTVLFSLLDKRREIQLMDKDGEMVKAAPNLLIIADMNPGYRGTKPLNEAEKDRYAHKLDFPYDKSIESKLIPSKSLLDLAANLRVSFDKEELMTPISTRALAAFVANTHSLGLDYAIYSYLNGFHESERNAVGLAIETRKANIAADFGLTLNTLPNQRDEKVIFSSTQRAF